MAIVREAWDEAVFATPASGEPKREECPLTKIGSHRRGREFSWKSVLQEYNSPWYMSRDSDDDGANEDYSVPDCTTGISEYISCEGHSADKSDEYQAPDGYEIRAMILKDEDAPSPQISSLGENFESKSTASASSITTSESQQGMLSACGDFGAFLLTEKSPLLHLSSPHFRNNVHRADAISEPDPLATIYVPLTATLDLHPQHQLILCSDPYSVITRENTDEKYVGEYVKNLWKCDVCHRQGCMKQVYHCPICDFDLCITCSRVNRSLLILDSPKAVEREVDYESENDITRSVDKDEVEDGWHAASRVGSSV